MTFPNVIKTAPEHPNIALMYPIIIERGPAAGGEALTDIWEVREASNEESFYTVARYTGTVRAVSQTAAEVRYRSTLLLKRDRRSLGHPVCQQLCREPPQTD